MPPQQQTADSTNEPTPPAGGGEGKQQEKPAMPPGPGPAITTDDTGAAAVDMESATVARACVDAAIPFMALRVILDPADLNLPRSAMEGFTGTGETDSLTVMKSTMRRPNEIIPMVRLAISDHKARKALSKTADAAAPFFGAI